MSAYAAVVGLVNASRLRAIYLAARHELQTVDPARDPDPALVALSNEPFETVEGAGEHLRRLERALRDRGDRRAVFLTIYHHMTRAVRAHIDAGTFTDPAWMREYTVTFANYYRAAFLAFERGRIAAVPDPWRIAFATAVNGDGLVVQDAVLGINAHINYDLALAIRDVGVSPGRATKRADHRAINGVLARLVDAQQAALAERYAPGVDDVDAVLGRLDESVSLFSMTEARDQAWRVGVVLAEVGWSPVQRYARWVLRMTATGGAAFALAPALSPELMRALEAVERDRLDLATSLETIDRRLAAVEPGSVADADE